MTSGIYYYIDKTNDEIIYIGKDSYIDKNKRHICHMSPSKYNEQHINKILQNNPDRYEYKILYAGNFDDMLLNALEINSIAEENPKFNFTMGGDGCKEYKHTKDAKIKISNAMKGKQNFLGKKHKQESKDKISKSKIGDKNPMKNPEIAKKVSKTLKGKRGPETSFYGKHHSESTKKQISHKKSHQQNTSGYYRVYKSKTNACKQGFCYRYRYYDNDGKRKYISSVDIKRLEEKVKKAGLEWVKFE